ncbi:MAG: 7-cyano-7-deazaguanine synthase QueC [Alphaproteobacteria bacterium]|nr:7-cyano-7-deazaguanine synthase QueC [Alphaproteobacteria bacterium]
MKTFVICSGGLDSVTLAYKVHKEHSLTGLISFDYGQRHKKELEFAKHCADDLKTQHLVLDISTIGKALSGSALTDNIDVPDGHYAEDTMKATIVPNRNAIMLSIAYGIASAQKAEAIATAVHGGDHFIYPDCRPEFINSFEAMQNHALDGVSKIQLYAPFVSNTKADIVKEGAKLNVPFDQTWSCYKGGDIHCGTCGTCVERQEAFALVGIKDPTQYANPNFWQRAIQKKSA